MRSTENPTGYPRFVLRSARGNYYFKTSDSYQILKSCSINNLDCFKSPGTCDSSCITACKNNTSKTCNMLITSPEFTSNLTLRLWIAAIVVPEVPSVIAHRDFCRSVRHCAFRLLWPILRVATIVVSNTPVCIPLLRSIQPMADVMLGNGVI